MLACDADEQGSRSLTARLVELRGHWEAWALVALLLVHVVLGVYWSVTIPIFEAHDEDGHYYFVRYLATQHRLPPPGERSPANRGNDQLHQPPLYYLLAAIPVALVDLDDEFVPKYNPYIGWSNEQGGGLNKVIHHPEIERWPYRGDVLAIHLSRWVSVLLGMLPLVFTFLTARMLAPEQPWVRWGAVLLHAFWPQYRFSTAVMNNDIMVSACMSAATWLAVRLVASHRQRAVVLLALVAVTGLGLLAKNNALAMVPVTLLALLCSILRANRALRGRLVGWSASSLLASVALVGLWYLRNVSGGSGMFGGVRGLGLIRGLLEGVLSGTRELRWDLAWVTLRHALVSLWAGFGWNNLGLPTPHYWAAAVLAAGGAGGLLLWLVRRPARKQVAAVGALILIVGCLVSMTLFYWVASGWTTMQGRYFLPALTALCVLLSFGWSSLCPNHLRSVAWALMGSGLAALSLVVPSAYIRPAYAAPPLLAEAELADYAPVHATFGDFVELAGYRIHNPEVSSDDSLRVTLAWRVLAQTSHDYELRVKVFDRDATLGEVWRYPGGGVLSTTTWQPGCLFAEEVSIPIRSESDDPRQAWLEVRYRGPIKAEVRDGQGRSIGEALRIGGIKVRGEAGESVPGSADGLQFGPAIRLVGGQAALSPIGSGWRVEVDLQWAAVQAPGNDYAVSLQLRNARDEIVVQADGQPKQGMYPTSLWGPGEVIEDPYTLHSAARWPDGSYTLYLCVYDVKTLARLSVRDPQGRALPDDEVALLAVTVGDGGELQIRPLWASIQVPERKDAGSALHRAMGK
jgi:hypothetical protein